jgi:LysR family transcriptional regulator, mexEF-oprN operon transcriptional activator
MHENYGRDLDLNLLRVLVVVADAGSVTAAASRLYLTQPAVSAALKRLQRAVGTPLLARRGRGIALTKRGQHLVQAARPHLEGLVTVAMSHPVFDPVTSRRSLRLGLSDSADAWLLPSLLHTLSRRAPNMQLIVVQVQFRTLRSAFESQRLDLAVTVADDVPAGTRRESLFRGRFVVLADSRRVKSRRLTMERYLAHPHVVVSYNGDARGIVEDLLGVERRVRCSVPSFASIGDIIEGTDLLATVPELHARRACERHPHLCMLPKPFSLRGAPMELLWSASLDDDPACAFLRGLVREIVGNVAHTRPARRPR